jgi:diaminohydroxyphosphoribosylaminopyrimidine deaminase / 5-amino-6-(5-phosphoribosylamino)uracil reductase
MYRCLELAALGAGQVAPNPMVGAVLVHDNCIIGEGWHQRYGGPHAEVNCMASVKEEDRSRIARSMLYVSLEPCAHFGKTPPCADLILQHQIPTVVIACRDPFRQVNGKGIERLQAGGVKVITGILEEEAKELNRRFFTFHTKHRPYIILKWAQTADGFIAAEPGQRLYISNELSNRLVHQWRSEEAAILVGTNTALLDNPELTTRLWPGNNPVRLVVDMELRLPSSLKLFNEQARTIVFNTLKHDEEGSLAYYQVTHDVSLVDQLLNAASQLNLQSIIVEGGAKLLQSFIDENNWDEARVIENTELKNNKGLPAPSFNGTIKLLKEFALSGDRIRIYRNDA